jgi:hypothetical protein
VATRRPADGGSVAGGPKPRTDEEQPGGAETGADEESTGGTATQPPETLDDLLRELHRQQYELDRSILHSKADLTGRENRRQRSRKQLAGLDRVATDLGRARADIDALIAAADRSVEAAKPLVERLDETVRDEITNGLAAIDKEIGDAETGLAGEVTKERAATADRDRLAVEVSTMQADHDEAEATLLGLPAAVKAAVAVLRAGRAGLDAAAAGGRPVEAAVLVSEVNRARERVQALRGPAHEKQLLENLRNAETALADSAGKLATAESGLIDQHDLVVRGAARRDDLIAARPDRIKQLEQTKKADAPATEDAEA